MSSGFEKTFEIVLCGKRQYKLPEAERAKRRIANKRIRWKGRCSKCKSPCDSRSERCMICHKQWRRHVGD